MRNTRLSFAILMLAALAACTTDNNTAASSAATTDVQAASAIRPSESMGWPASRPGEDPPASPLPTGDGAAQLKAAAAPLPIAPIVEVTNSVGFGYTVIDISDPVLMEFQTRAMAAQINDGSRVQHAYHWYGHPDNNPNVALVPVEFKNRYGTRLYGEIVLPKRGQVQAQNGAYPVILALEGLNTNTSVYRWWHQLFADAGYLVFAFDFSGQGHSDDESAGDPGNNIEEAQDALTYLLEKSAVKQFLDTSKIGVIGHSMGAITTMGLQAVEPRIKAAVAAAPISEIQSVFDKNPIPVMIQTGDHDGPVAPIPFANPAVVKRVYDKLTSDRAFIVADAATHAQHTNYPLLPTSTWGREIAANYSLAWMNHYLRGDANALKVLRTGHPKFSYLWESEVFIGGERKVFRGTGPSAPTAP
jgi:alpha-beta hydrolase superfamily lysophospholipase